MKVWIYLLAVLVVAVPTLLVLAKQGNWITPKADTLLPYKTVNGQTLSLHAFTPSARTTHTSETAIVLFHGGRWLHGSPRAMYPQCQFFAKHGYHCFSAQYRLGTNGTVDVRALIQDASDALQYLRDNAAKLGMNAKQIVAGGGSAGGHLAAAIGLGLDGMTDEPAGRLIEIARPAALLLYNPMIDLSPGTPDYPLVKDYWKSVSPRHHIDEQIPPTLVLVGSQDSEVPIPTVTDFCAAIEAQGRTCELAIYEGQGHGFFNHAPYLQQTNERALAFLRALEL